MLAVVGTVAGGLAGGLPGVVTGLMLAFMITAAVAAGAAAWARQIGVHLDPEEMQQVAPRPPGFAKLCDAVYSRF